MKKKERRIETFKKSIDYRDICYFIDHVQDIEFRKSLISELGYHIGLDVTKIDNQEKNIFIGRKKELRMFVSNKFKSINLAYTVIIENY